MASERDALKWKLAQIKKSYAEVGNALLDLQAAVRARQNAEAELRELYRERAIARARAAERDPNAALN